MAFFTTLSPRGLILLVLLIVVAAQSSDLFNDEPQLDQQDDLHHHEDEIATPHEPLAYRGVDGAAEHALGPRISFGGVDINMDTLANDVYDKVDSKVNDAVDQAKNGLNSTIEAAKDGVTDAVEEAKKGVSDAIAAAKGVLEDIKNSVEELYEKVKEKVTELEQELSQAVRKWVWEHIGKPLVVLAVILLSPFALLFLWWFLHLVAKPFAHERAPPSFEMQTRGQGSGPYAGEQAGTSGGSGVQKTARFIIRSWEGYGQGLICFVCPWYGTYVLWKGRNKMRKDIDRLRRDLDTIWKERREYWREGNGARKEPVNRF